MSPTLDDLEAILDALLEAKRQGCDCDCDHAIELGTWNGKVHAHVAHYDHCALAIEQSN